MRVIDGGMRGNRKFWPKLSLKKWLRKRKKEKQGYYADDLDDDTDSELEDLGSSTWGEMERRYSCSATDFHLSRPLNFCAASQPRRHSATLMPKDCDILKSNFTEIQNYRIFVGTWNVGGKAPNDSLDIEEWLGSLKEPADIYVIGFQEVVPLSAGNVLGAENNAPVGRWQRLIRQTLNVGSTTAGYGSEFRRSCSTPSSVWQQQEAMAMEFTDTFDEYFGADLNLTFSGRATPISGAGNCCNRSHRGGTTASTWSPSSRYSMIASKQMVGLFVSVWAKNDLRRFIRNVKVSCIGCGLMGYLGNKGSISISMCLHQTTFCFVCSHLASGQRDGDEIRRNADVAEILRRTQFRRSHDINGAGLPETILDHDRVIWLGDLNYRLALSPSVTRSLLAKEDWDALLEKDQLHIQRKAGRVFSGWQEGKIYFAPTYKYRANSDTYTLHDKRSKLGEKKRTPAWCDRILWHGSGLKQLAYVRAETKFSDHRPVYAVFAAQVEVLCKDKLRDFLVFKSAKESSMDARVSASLLFRSSSSMD